ncbi:MAG: ribose 5-phosphate isomerase B [Alphaproteobacteria bacterium]
MHKTIAFAADHGGFELKNLLLKELQDKGYQTLDLGTNSSDSVDYPDYAAKMAGAIKNKLADTGVLICGSGIGISISANRYPYLRAALIYDGYGAKMSRLHNNANVIVFGGRTIGIETAKDCLNIFLNTEFEGGRHQKRIDKMSNCGCSLNDEE